METLNNAIVIDVLRAVGRRILEEKDYFTELDSAIGDADHGINMARGFELVSETLDTLAGKDVGAILKAVGMALVREVGGASGPLYGTAFMEAAKPAQGKPSVTGGDLVEMARAALEGVKKRGRSDVGDKTMIDAMASALQACEEALAESSDIVGMMEKAAAGAEKGLEDTVPMIAKKGRASYLGKRSVGHKDPGAASSALMIRTAARVIGGSGCKTS